MKKIIQAQRPPQEDIKNLLISYQSGKFEVAQDLALLMSKKFPEHPLGWKVLGALFGQAGKMDKALVANQNVVRLDPKDINAHFNLGVVLKELAKLEQAEASYSQAITLKPDYASAHNNLGNVLKELGKLEQAEASYSQAITLKPEFSQTHFNLGVVLKELGKLEQAEASYSQAITLKPDYASAHNNLGNVLKELGKLEQAEASYSQAITLKPDYAGAHNNLGNVQKELGKLEQAEASYSQAINLRPDYADAHNNLGSILKNLGKFKQAEVSYRKAIALMPDYADAHQNMAIILYINGDIDSALESMEKANSIDSKSKKNRLLLNILYARRDNEKKVATTKNASPSEYEVGLSSNPLILKRIVEPDLIKSLYKMNSRELDKSKDARYGNGRCSLDFDLFEDDWSILKIVSDDLIRIMTKAVKSEVYVYDSFFNILGAGGGSKPHDHINNLDKDNILNLRNQKYSLVYYLSAGDQSSSEPGTLKLYDPDEDILPYEGMIVIIPASRKHSAVYDGSKDRVMIGINFYSL